MTPTTSTRRAAAVLAAGLALLLPAGCGGDDDEPKVPLLHVPSPAWEDQIVYFVMTDRFANGDPSNDDQGMGEHDPSVEGRYSGGDLQGIVDRLDYVQGLGATAIWITPPVANMWWDPLQQYGGYHGYWARDLKQVDEHLGTLDTYKALSSALHERGMYLVQDVVPNHMGNYFQYSSYDPSDPGAGVVRNLDAVPTSAPTQAPFDQCDPTNPAHRAAAIYHWTPAIADYSDPVQEKSWQISDLDDLDTENPVVRQALRDSYGYWVREVGVDAFRVDTAKFAPVAFWNDLFESTDAAAPGLHGVARATGRDGLFAFGEVYEISDPYSDAAEQKLRSYLGTAEAPALPSVLQFPLYGEIGRVFASGKPTADLTYRLERFMDPALFPDPTRVPTFVDNHDVRRFLSVGTPGGLAQALAFIFTLPGIPVVYYGTEQAFTETRAAMFAGGYLQAEDRYDTTSPGYQRLKALSALRRGNPVFTRGELEVLYDTSAGAGAFAYARRHAGETALVLMNTADEAVLVNGLATGLPAGAELEVLFSEQEPPAPAVDAAGALTLALPARAVLVVRATGRTVPPGGGAPAITVTTPIEGQTFTDDTVVSGTVSPASTKLRMVIDGYLDRATPVAVATDGTFSATLPVSLFPTGVSTHDVAFYAYEAGAATPRLVFTSDVTFVPAIVEVEDPAGDDRGPTGTYSYPQDSTFGRQMDVTKVRIEAGRTTMLVKITMADWTTVWNPTNGFDHVAFNVFFEVPGVTGATLLPQLQAEMPAGTTWRYYQFSGGWDHYLYDSTGATATLRGTPRAAPFINVSGATRTITFTYDRSRYPDVATWSGVKVYVTTWDFDGIGAAFRPISPDGGQWIFGGAPETSPKIMDDVAPITIPEAPAP